jgi:hypothetical protein
MKVLADALIYGVDWDGLASRIRNWGPIVAGALFGAGTVSENMCVDFVHRRSLLLKLLELNVNSHHLRSLAHLPLLVLFPHIGWWCFLDALVEVHTTQGHGYPFKYNWPGIIATVALLLINVVPRETLVELRGGIDEALEYRARLWLFISFIIAFAAVGGSVGVLVTCSGIAGLEPVGVGSVLQSGLILASALLLWAFRSDGESSGYGYL